MHIFYHVGNDPFSDCIIDILDFIDQENRCPIAIRKGFPIYLPKFPENIKFVFIINENEIYNHDLKNPVPYPLIDRLDHLFMNEQILKSCSEYLLDNTLFDRIKAKYLLDLPLNEEEQKQVKKNPDKTKEKYYLNYDKSDFEYLIEALKAKDQSKGKEILKNHFKNTFIQNFNDFLSKMKGNSNGGLPFYSAIVFTRTPIYENIIFDGIENFEIIKDSQSNPDEVLRDIDSSKSIIYQSDIFNMPNDYTINNALSIIKSMEQKIIEDMNVDKKQYIIIFHVKENRIPEGFGCTCYFPVVWIQSLTDISEDYSLIQEICQTIYNRILASNSPLLNKTYTKISYDIKDKLEEKQKNKINELFSLKGAKIKGAKGKNTLSIQDIIDSISKLALIDNSEKYSKQTITFTDIQKTIFDLIVEIENNLKENKDDEDKNIKNKILNEELYNFDLESRFLSTISPIVDNKFIAVLSIVIKYLAAIKLSNTDRDTIESFIKKTYKYVSRLSKIVNEINYDTFSSPVEKNEINNKYPELVFYNILKPYFKVNVYYNSLNKMKLLIKNLPFNRIKLIDVFTYINNNYYGVSPYLPYNEKYNSTQITIDAFNDFLDSRGLFYKRERGIQDLIDFMKDREYDICPYLFDREYLFNNIKHYIDSGNWKDVEYKQILLFDCHTNFIDKCNANDYPHPSIIYSHFINVDGFSFKDYNNNDPDGKIYKIQLIPWLINFFLYGSFNNYKEKENFLKNIVNFIDLGLNTDYTNFLTMMSLSTELKHFIFDFLFTEYCKKPENEKEKLESFDYLEHLESNNLLQKLIKDHADIKDKIKDSCISNGDGNSAIVVIICV